MQFKKEVNMKPYEGNEKKWGRVIIAAPGSGAGKTLVTCALIRLLSRRGIPVSAFKCGPDFIDPMFHRKVLGVPSENADLFLAGSDGVRHIFGRAYRVGRLSLVEGVMGFYDGMGADSLDGSTWEIAEATDTPAILTVNARGMSRSIVPLAAGFLRYRNPSHIRGVILNRVSPSIYPAIKERIEKELRIPVLGFLPELKEGGWQSRHLGLVAPDEIRGLLAGLDKAADALEKSFDLERFLDIAAEAETCAGKAGDRDQKKEHARIEAEEPAIRTANPAARAFIPDKESDGKETFRREKTVQKPERRVRPRIAVARDAAFSFYYEENLRLMEEMGGEICFFSPIKDSRLPEGTSGLILGGGYPELHAAELSQNSRMLCTVREAAESGMPILAECGGFLYLLRDLTDGNGNQYPMAGVLHGSGYMTDKLVRFGYVEVETEEDTPFLPRGARIRAHEFHYAESTDNGHSCREVKPVSGRMWPCMVSTENIFAGFPHLYYPSCPQLAHTFVKRCGAYCT